MSATTRRDRRPLVVSGLSLLLAAGVALFVPAAATPQEQVGRVDTAPAFTATKALTRVFENADGTRYEFETNTVTVTASETRNLRGRQRIRISWTSTVSGYGLPDRTGWISSRGAPSVWWPG